MLNFFVDVGKNTDKDIPCGNCCLTSFLKGNFPDSMFLSPVTSVEVDSYISQMDNNKSIGPYSIPVTLLKILKTHIFPLISSLINDSFLCVFSPVNLNWQKLPQFLRKVRPISVLSIFSKIFEKAMFKRLMVILNLVTFFIHSNLALGKSARQSCLIQITESIRNSIDDNEFGYGIFIDKKRHLIQLIVSFFYQN